MKNRREVIVYVAGPFRAKPVTNQWEQHKNILLAESKALALWREGFTVICPHSNTAHFQGSCPDEAFLNGDLEILKRCDAVLFIPGWEDSKGAYAEYVFVRERKIFTTTNLSDLLALYPQIDHEPSVANE